MTFVLVHQNEVLQEANTLDDLFTGALNDNVELDTILDADVYERLGKLQLQMTTS